ncbi:ABC transporter family substrate-binding protein [Streptomyces sp. ECR3]|uniref:ABC transporter family substrate-binding protein n=1 Tax=Streptomyces sp. ECR3 TaxID=3400630 RepID=UPI003F1BD14B
MSHDGVRPSATRRAAAFLLAGALTVSALSACSSDEKENRPLAGQDIAPAGRALVADGGTLRWAVDAVPATLNTFQADADAATSRVAGAVLPSLFRLDARGRPQPNPAYLESAKVVDTEPRQVVLYRLDQQAVWSDGREIGAADFAAQWRALSGKDSAYWTARNAGYDRIAKIERGHDDLEVKVTFARPYADWKSLFTPLYPKEVMGTPDAFNDGARSKLKVTAGPFALKKVDREDGKVTLVRSTRWWGSPAKLDKIVLRAVPRDERLDALAENKVDLAEVDPDDAERIAAAHGTKTTAASQAAAGAEREKAEKAERAEKAAKKEKEEKDKKKDEKKGDEDAAEAAARRKALRRYVVRSSLEPAYTQLALNGSEGPLADERVRRAVARALDRTKLAELVLKPLGLPAVPVGSHLALAGQPAYEDNSGALGGQDTKGARALLADAGWILGGPVEKQAKDKKDKKGKDEDGDEAGEKDTAGSKGEKSEDDDGTYIVGEDDKPGEAEGAGDHGGDGRSEERAARSADGKQYLGEPGAARHGGAPGAYAPMGTAAPARAADTVMAKDGKALSLRFVLPSGPGSASLRAVGDRIARMLRKVGIRTTITKVPDDSYFKDHIASGEYDLALYSWPATAFPATDARPVYAKPVPGADGELKVEQNYTRVGTDRIDQLFDEALVTLDAGKERELMRKADSRIWAGAASIPLYQRPQLTAARPRLVNVGAFGFRTPVYEDMGYQERTPSSASTSSVPSATSS